MSTGIKEKYIYWIFEYSLVIKAINSVWQIALGIFILMDKHLQATVYTLTQNEIIEDPHAFLAPKIQHAIGHLSHGSLKFIGIYLLGQGLIKVFLVIGMFMKKIWTYQVSMYAFFIFVFYQIYRFNHTHAPLLIFFSLFDLATILLIQHEYKRLEEHLPAY